MKVEQFEELVAWQKARSLTCVIYQATRQGTFAKDLDSVTKFSVRLYQ
jgi:hypothetical protein